MGLLNRGHCHLNLMSALVAMHRGAGNRVGDPLGIRKSANVTSLLNVSHEMTAVSDEIVSGYVLDSSECHRVITESLETSCTRTDAPTDLLSSCFRLLRLVQLSSILSRMGKNCRKRFALRVAEYQSVNAIPPSERSLPSFTFASIH